MIERPRTARRREVLVSRKDPIFYWIGQLNRRTRWRWSRAHVWLYRRLRGHLVGGLFGRPIILLTTVGAKTGQTHTVPVTCFADGDCLLVLASYSSDWYRNLMVAGSAEVERKGRRFRVQAELVADAATRQRFRDFYPALSRIEHAQEGREVPLIRLTSD